MPGPEFDDLAAEIAKIDQEVARELICKYEGWADQKLAEGEITQEVAWDCYFSLFHECEERMLWSDRQRILGKIDTDKYNPLLSKNPGVVMIARIRAASNKANSN